MSRVVADTNIYISAVMFGGLPSSVLDLGLLRTFTLVISQPLLDELEDKLRVKFGVSAGNAAAIRAKLENAADVVNPNLMLDVVKDDPDDNRVLECAVAGRADYKCIRFLQDLPVWPKPPGPRGVIPSWSTSTS